MDIMNKFIYHSVLKLDDQTETGKSALKMILILQMSLYKKCSLTNLSKGLNFKTQVL